MASAANLKKFRKLWKSNSKTEQKWTRKTENGGRIARKLRGFGRGGVQGTKDAKGAGGRGHLQRSACRRSAHCEGGRGEDRRGGAAKQSKAKQGKAKQSSGLGSGRGASVVKLIDDVEEEGWGGHCDAEACEGAAY